MTTTTTTTTTTATATAQLILLRPRTAWDGADTTATYVVHEDNVEDDEEEEEELLPVPVFLSIACIRPSCEPPSGEPAIGVPPPQPPCADRSLRFATQ